MNCNLNKFREILELPKTKTLTLLIGIPNAGKTTLAKLLLSENQSKRIVVSTDEVRSKLLNTSKTHIIFDKSIEGEVWDIIEGKVLDFLENQNALECILDATNITRKLRSPFVEMAKIFNVKTRFILLKVELYEAIRRNHEREIPILESIIVKFSELYQEPMEDECDELFVIE